MTDLPTVRGPEVHRPRPSATWKINHRWGTSLGDVTTYTVTRTLGGGMKIQGGKESFEIRAELVPLLAEMIAAAAAWEDGTDD